MKKSRLLGAVCVTVIGFLCASGVHAAIITEFTDLATYNTAVGSHSIIGFNDGFSDRTVITNQYAGQGVIFNDGNDTIQIRSAAFITDGVGLDGHPADGLGTIDISFSSSMTHIGTEYPGALQIELYLGATLIDTSSQFSISESGTGSFGGVISSPFDRVVLIDWYDGSVNIDNLHFATIVPIPASVWLFGSGLLGLVGIARRKKAA